MYLLYLITLTTFNYLLLDFCLDYIGCEMQLAFPNARTILNEKILYIYLDKGSTNKATMITDNTEQAIYTEDIMITFCLSCSSSEVLFLSSSLSAKQKLAPHLSRAVSFIVVLPIPFPKTA